MFAGLVQVRDLFADIGRIGHRLAGHVENDVAALYAVFRSRAIGIYRGD
jgi:hypothetical protein